MWLVRVFNEDTLHWEPVVEVETAQEGYDYMDEFMKDVAKSMIKIKDSNDDQ